MSWVRVWLDCFQIDSEWTGEWPVEIDPEWVFYQKVFNLEVLKPHLLWMNLFIKSRRWFDKNSSDFNLGWRSKIPQSNVTWGQTSRGQLSLVVKCHLRSNALWSNVTCGQMSLRSNVPRSNVTCGQMSRGQMSLWSNVTKSWSGQKSVVKCPVVKWDCGHRRSTLLGGYEAE
jgi:hypothetical protein